MTSKTRKGQDGKRRSAKRKKATPTPDREPGDDSSEPRHTGIDLLDLLVNAETATAASRACAATQEAIIRSGVKLLDRMIRLTEIREKGINEITVEATE